MTIDPFSPEVERLYQKALAGLSANTRPVYGYAHPVLIEGGAYPGIWLECGPLEAAIYGRFMPEVAIHSHSIFFHHQRPDGQFPCWIRDHTGWAQIQMVVPIAATAWEVAQVTAREDFLTQAYQACTRWDDWLSANRNTRGTGLCELFCGYDTGHDRSPRIAGIPNRCPENDARNFSKERNLPWLAPDLSATMYGGRVALGAMAVALGKPAEAQAWLEKAEAIRKAILAFCYDAEDEFFYDVDAQGNFNRVRADQITRVLGEHVVEQALFERIYTRHIVNPEAFWSPYPLPSVALNDPHFVRLPDGSLPLNSWGGASQALTALRAPRWFTHYGKASDLKVLMERWIEALLRADEFMQQMDPLTGEFNTSPGYSPAMCVVLDFVDRLRVL